MSGTLASPLPLAGGPSPNPSRLREGNYKADFPGLKDWHYLDTAATAQKPQAVIDAMSRALGEDYATVHRGVYARSANMTLAYELARKKIASFVGASDPNEIVFVRGATEAINLVVYGSSVANGTTTIPGLSTAEVDVTLRAEVVNFIGLAFLDDFC